MMAQNLSSPGVQLTSLLEHIPIGVLIIDADFRIVHVNRIGTAPFSNAEGSIIGRDFGELVRTYRDPAYAAEVTLIFRRTLTTGEPYSKAETAPRRERSSNALYEWRVERILMEDGRHGLACFFRDISREVYAHQIDSYRVKLTDALRPLTSPGEVQATAAKLLAESLHVSAVVYAEVETRGGIDYLVVQQHYRASGTQDLSGQFRMRDFGQTLFDEMRAGRALIVNDVDYATLNAEEKKAHTALGLRAYVAVPLVKEGRHVALLAAHQSEPRDWLPIDLALVEETAERTWAAAERAKVESQMRANQLDSARQRRLYEAILSNTPDFAYIFDPQYRIIYANDILLKMWGRTWDQAIGKTFLEVGYEPWHAELHCREIDQVIATRRPIRGEVPFNGTFGRRMYDYIFVPVIGVNGEVEAVAGTTRDVTDIKESERRKDEFLATLAHELRNPLAPIRNAIHVLSLSAQGNAATTQVCSMMERQVSHMVRLVDDLMEISRISRGIIELRRESTTLDAIVRSAVDTSMPLINSAKHKLNIELPHEPVGLYGDPVRLAQVVANLLNNAAKYTDRGGEIRLSAKQQDAQVLISVRDTGIGIDAEALPRVFEMFMQVKNASSHTHGGLGIGLSLAKHLVEMHGGTISASSKGPGKGSEFCVSLPSIKFQQETAGATGAEAANTPEVRKRVLIVDDNEDAASTLSLLVTRLGADVQVAHDGPTALALLESFDPEIALLDLGMPVMSGFDIAAKARQMPTLANLKLIALTGWGQPEDRERTRAAGFDHHLVKPASLPELQQLLASFS